MDVPVHARFGRWGRGQGGREPHRDSAAGHRRDRCDGGDGVDLVDDGLDGSGGRVVGHRGLRPGRRAAPLGRPSVTVPRSWQAPSRATRQAVQGSAAAPRASPPSQARTSSRSRPGASGAATGYRVAGIIPATRLCSSRSTPAATSRRAMRPTTLPRPRRTPLSCRFRLRPAPRPAPAGGPLRRGGRPRWGERRRRPPVLAPPPQ